MNFQVRAEWLGGSQKEYNVVEAPPHYRTIKKGLTTQYIHIPYTQFYFDIDRDPPRFLTGKSFSVGITNSHDSILMKKPLMSIFEANTTDLFNICWGEVIIIVSKQLVYENRTSYLFRAYKDIISAFWNSEFYHVGNSTSLKNSVRFNILHIERIP